VIDLDDFEELALQQAGSRAQDAIKRLDCGAADGPDE
jgi:hypothetical protein